jgi:hypothetical protein
MALTAEDKAMLQRSVDAYMQQWLGDFISAQSPEVQRKLKDYSISDIPWHEIGWPPDDSSVAKFEAWVAKMQSTEGGTT